MYRTGDGLTVYEVEAADRAASIDGRAVLKFIGGDGPFVVVMPEAGRVQTATQLLTGHPNAVDFALEVEGLTIIADMMGRSVLTVHMRDDAVLNFIVPAASQKRIAEQLPRVSALRPWGDALLGASLCALAALSLFEVWRAFLAP